jgi:carbamoyl-phosphate synthase small subunit
MPVAMGSGVNESELAARAASAPPMEGQALAVSVSTARPYQVPATGDRRGKVVAIDLGIKRDILRQLAGRGFDVEVMPATVIATEITERQPDGIFLSNGPGDPEPLTQTVATLRDLIGKVPIFGICLGHQVFGLALGARTFKLPFGHHGGNHPVRRLEDGRVAITSQNHGFAVDLQSIAKGDRISGELPPQVETDFGAVIPTHQNLNDGTLEGMRSLEVPAFSVQFHPEAAPGPRDAVKLFDDFVELMDRA